MKIVDAPARGLAPRRDVGSSRNFAFLRIGVSR